MHASNRRYMAPEVFLASSTRQSYSYEVDWFSYGVVVYELCEQALPFGPEPMFESVEDEFRNPELIDEDGVEVPHLYDMLAALLDWDPKGRLKDDTICDHPYWQNADCAWTRARARPPHAYTHHAHAHRARTPN